MKAISIRQPWASLLLLGEKDIEVRTWRSKHRGPTLIHTGKTSDHEAIEYYKLKPEYYGYVIGYGELSEVKEYKDLEAFQADRERHKNYWNPEDEEFPLFGWVFENVRDIEPFKQKGQLSFFEVHVDENHNHGLDRFGVKPKGGGR